MAWALGKQDGSNDARPTKPIKGRTLMPARAASRELKPLLRAAAVACKAAAARCTYARGPLQLLHAVRLDCKLSSHASNNNKQCIGTALRTFCCSRVMRSRVAWYSCCSCKERRKSAGDLV